MSIPGLGGLGDILGGLLGEGSVARQFFVWGFLSNVVSAATEPFVQALQDKVWANSPIRPLSPADLADMTVRGVVGADFGVAQAALSGVSADNFNLMVTNTGEPPALQEMLMLLRRGKVDQATIEKAIRQSRVRDEWIPYVLQMGLDEPTPTDILEAYLKGQVTEGDAATLYAKLGGDPDYFQILYDTRGEGPSPNEAAEMARRGLIPWDGVGAEVTSYQQAVLEGMFRNKWATAFRGLSEYIPPPRTVGTLYAEGALSQAQALNLYAQAGLSPELAAAYLQGAVKTKVAVHRNLAQGTVTKLYEEQAVTLDQAMSLLEVLGYDQGEAQFIILLADLARYEKYWNTAITAVHAQYVSHKISESAASQALDEIGAEATERDHLLKIWTIERGAKVQVLSNTDIRKAMNDGIITSDDAMSRMVDKGWSQADATIYLQL